MYNQILTNHLTCPWPKVMSEYSFPDVEVDRMLLIGQLQQQIKLSQLINQINTEIRSSLDLDQVFASACQLLGEVLQVSRVSILIKETDELEQFITRGEYNQSSYPDQLGLTVPINDNTHLQTLMSQKEALAVTDFPHFPGFGEATQALVTNLGIKSMLAIATRYQGQVNGIIGLQQCDRYREWTMWEKELLEGVAAQLAIAINQAQLYAETRRQADRESLLRLISNQIRSSLDLPTILHTAVRKVRQLLNTDRVVIYQFQENWGGEIVVEDLIVPWPSILSDQIEDNCFVEKYARHYQQGRAKAIDDIHQAGLDSCHVNFLEKLQVKANLIVPIVMVNYNNISQSNQAHVDRLWGLLIAHECQNTRHWQRREIELLQKLAEQMAIAIQQAELYHKVQDSATKYQMQAQELASTLSQLQETQQQLIQSEKMSSLGQMVAGIAHEINNPNNFIHANLYYTQQYIDTLFVALDTCAQTNPEMAAIVAELDTELDLSYIREDFPKLLQSMRQGSTRIKSIVEELRAFSRLDEAEVKAVDINAGIDSSLAMLQHRCLTNGIKLHKIYGELPLVKCKAAQINQVFFNLINNAIDALEEVNTPKKLIITTEAVTGDRIKIEISDNGIGIPEAIKHRIFDPFFTTKPVGKGTGMGLAISYQIIVKGHGGQITCISETGCGSKFVVELPIS